MHLQAAVVLLVAPQPHQSGLRSLRGAPDSGGNERLQRKCVKPSEDGQIVVDGGGAVLVAGVTEVFLAADAIHDVGHGLVDPSPYCRDGNAVLAQQPLERHLVLEGEDERHVRAVAAHH